LKRDAFSWTQEATHFFEKLNEATCRTLVPATLDLTKPFIVDCDALWDAISVVLMKEGRPLAFESNQCKGKNLLNPFMKMKCCPHYMQLRNDMCT